MSNYIKLGNIIYFDFDDNKVINFVCDKPVLPPKVFAFGKISSLQLRNYPPP